MKAPLLFSLIPAAMGLHVLLATKFGFYDRHTIVPAVLILPALGGLFALLRTTPSTSMWVLNITAWCLTAGFVWWTQSYSSYDRSTTPSAGATIVRSTSTFNLTDSEGNAFDLPAAVAAEPATLLLFFRGHW